MLSSFFSLEFARSLWRDSFELLAEEQVSLMDSPELLFRSKDDLKKSSICWFAALLTWRTLSICLADFSFEAINKANAFLAWVRRFPKHCNSWWVSCYTFPFISSFSYYSWLVISLTLYSKSLTLVRRSISLEIGWHFPFSKVRCCLYFWIRLWIMAFLFSIYRSCLWIVLYNCMICPLCLKISYLNYPTHLSILSLMYLRSIENFYV